MTCPTLLPRVEAYPSPAAPSASPPRATPRHSRLRLFERPMFILTFLSNCWIIFGKLWAARSRLHRRRFLQVNTRLKALDEIYKIYTLLHRSDLDISTIFIKRFRIFAVFFSKVRWCFAIVVQNAPILMNPEFQQIESVKLNPYKKMKMHENAIFNFRRETF